MRIYLFEEELKHYGVLGMKWGVRKDRESSGNKRPPLQKGDVVLSKGTNFQRIAGSSNMNYTQGVFLSYKTSDKDLYRGVLGRMRVSWMVRNEPGEVKLKQMTFTANKEIRIPNRQTRLDEFKKLYMENKQEVIDLINDGETHSNRRTNHYDSNKDYSADATMYERFNHALALGVSSEHGGVISKYYNALKEKGYDAVPDENDIRLSTFKASAPLIFFNTMDSIGSVKVKDLSAGEIFEAYNRSIGIKTAKSLLLPTGIGHEKLNPDSASKIAEANRQQQMDKNSLNKNYTLTDLGKDWGTNRLTSAQIRKVSALMDAGKTHDAAVQEVIFIGNNAADKILSKLKL